MLTRERFAALAEKYMDMVFRVAYGYMRSRDDADDVTQEVLLRLYRTDTLFESEEHVKNWLLRVTVNQCKKVVRSPWRRVESIEDYASTLRFETEEDRGLFCGIMRLEQKYRVAVLMYYYEGYSQKEIAEMLSVPEETVRTRLFRARGKLKTTLKEVLQYD